MSCLNFNSEPIFFQLGSFHFFTGFTTSKLHPFLLICASFLGVKYPKTILLLTKSTFTIILLTKSFNIYETSIIPALKPDKDANRKV